MSYIRRAQARLKVYVRTRHEEIRVTPQLGLFNFRCFENAVEYCRRYPDLQVAEVIYIDGDYPVLHYINYDPVKKEYLETTLGWRAEFLEYYFIRIVHKDSHRHIGNEFERAMRGWTDQFVGWFGRYVLRVDRIL